MEIISFFIHQDYSIELTLANNTNALLSEAQVYEILTQLQEKENDEVEEILEEDDISS